MISKQGSNFPEDESATSTDQFAQALESARSGSSEDRARVIEMFRDYLRLVAVDTLGTQRVGQLSASDVVQSTIIDANRGFEGCRANSHGEFKAWLKQILLNDVINRYRRLRSQKRDVRREQSLDRTVHDFGQSETPSAEAIRQEDQQRLERAMRQLSDDQRQVVTMRQRDQMPFDEIARVMNRTPESARKLWSRAVAALAGILRDSDQ
ncbi:MAG: sigma-70 family RNA polymerase sigma factor [Planctomycetota bacterium]